MKTEEIIELFRQFESIANEYEGVECWSARELAKLLGYAQWRNFENIVNKAKAACEHAEQEVSYHFAEVGKMVSLGSGFGTRSFRLYAHPLCLLPRRPER